MFKPFPRNQLATKAQSFPRQSSNTASPMIARHANDFTWNRRCSSNSPPLKRGDQIPHPLGDSDNQIPSSPGRQRCQMSGVCPGGHVEASIWPIHNLPLSNRSEEVSSSKRRASYIPVSAVWYFYTVYTISITQQHNKKTWKVSRKRCKFKKALYGLI